MAAYSCLSKSSAPLMQMILIFFFKCGWGSVFVLSSTGLYVSNHAEGKLLYRSELAIEVETPRVWNAQKAGRISCPVRGAAEGFWINVINVCMYIFLPFFPLFPPPPPPADPRPTVLYQAAPWTPWTEYCQCHSAVQLAVSSASEAAVFPLSRHRWKLPTVQFYFSSSLFVSILFN